MELSNHFWDCECEEHYIHSSSETVCVKCSAQRDEMPDSRQDEIDEGSHFATI